MIRAPAPRARGGHLTRAPVGRAGVGVLLILVVTLALVLFVAGLAQLFSSGQVYRQTARGSGGLTAEYLARSAVAELFWRVQKGATTPSSPFFRRIREVLLTGEQSPADDGLIDFSKDFEVPELFEQLDRSEHKAFYRNFKLQALSVRAGIDRTRANYTNLVLKLSATVALNLGANTVVRRVEETRQIGILLVAPKRPLDQVTFLVLDHPFLPDFRRACLGVRELAQIYLSISRWLAVWKTQVEAKPMGAEMSFAMALPGDTPDRPAKQVHVMLTGEQYRFDGLWAALSGDPSSIKPPPEHAYLMAPAGASIELAGYDHEAHLGENVENAIHRIPDLAGRIDRAMQAFVDASGRPFSAGEHAAWSAQMGQVGVEVHDVLDTLVTELTRVSGEMAPHLKNLPALDDFSLDAQGRLGPPLYPIAYHISTQAEFDALLARHKRLNAHIAYQGDQPLKISLMPQSGRLVISSLHAPIEVSNLVAGAKEEDAFVLAGEDVSFKGGLVDASVLVRGRAHFSAGTTIRGNLVLEHLPRKRDRGQDQDLHGRVIYNPELAAGTLKPPRDLKGAKLDRYAVGFSTVPQDVDISWKP